jgi:hypothetical protein
VTIRLTDHLNPTPRELVQAAEAGARIDTDAPRFYTVPERVGEFPCRD